METWQKTENMQMLCLWIRHVPAVIKSLMSSVIKLNPSRIVYISCGPETLARDLEYFDKTWL